MYVFFGGKKIFVETFTDILSLDSSSNQFLHFEEKFESFSAYLQIILFGKPTFP